MGKTIDRTKAKIVARNFFYERINLTRHVPLKYIQISDEEVIKENNENILYIFNFKDNKGWVIVSGTDNYRPVVSYSFNSKFDIKKLTPEFKELISEEKRVVHLRANQKAVSRYKVLWERYLNTKSFKLSSIKSAGPLLKTAWYQDDPYNDSCPAYKLSNGYIRHCLTGCVATAMAQIMNFYQYPDKGNGYHSYTDTTYGKQSANFGATTYNWGNMNYSSLSNFDTLNPSIPQLMYHCGVSVDMRYGPSTSSAIGSKPMEAFAKYFNYHKGIILQRSLFTEEQWDSMLYNEIDSLRPVYYVGVGGSADHRSSHAFVCDGYQGDYFHLNLGGGWTYVYLDKMYYHEYQYALFKNQPVAHFKVKEYKNYSPPDTVQFIDMSMDHPVSWLWDFGDGKTSTDKNPTHVYTNPGSYTVKLTVTTDSNVVYTRIQKNCIHISKVGFRKTDIDLPYFGMSASDWGDYDNDGDLDLIICGYRNDTTYSKTYTKIYRNDGNGAFTGINDSIIGVTYLGSVAWGDYDNDGDLDFIECGDTNVSYEKKPATFLYENIGNDQFKLVPANFPGYYLSDIKWGDLNNDGLLDFIISGASSYIISGKSWPGTNIFKNLGNGQFELVHYDYLGNNVNYVKLATIALADYDNDGDLDIAFSGMDYQDSIKTYLLKNNGDFQFEKVDVPFKNIYEGNIQWGDYDNDGDLDVLITGNRHTGFSYYPFTMIYQNNNNQFREVNTKIDSLGLSRAYWGDYDNDGLLDFVITGGFEDKFNIRYSEMKLYHNEGNNQFVCYNNSLEGLTFGNVYFVDYNNDGALDIFANGRSEHGLNWSDGKTVLYTSLLGNKNEKPSPPGNLSAKLIDNNTVKLSWSRSKDDHTPSKGLSYNIFIGMTPNTQEIVSSMSNIKTGKRLIASMGNVCQDTTWTIYNLKGNQTYYWSVQSIDGSYQGSNFAPINSFTTTNLNVGQNQAGDKLISIYPNPCNNTINIDLTKINSSVMISILNSLGQILYCDKTISKLSLKEKTINCSKWPNGIYFLRVHENNTLWVKKFIVQH